MIPMCTYASEYTHTHTLSSCPEGSWKQGHARESLHTEGFPILSEDSPPQKVGLNSHPQSAAAVRDLLPQN